MEEELARLQAEEVERDEELTKVNEELRNLQNEADFYSAKIKILTRLEDEEKTTEIAKAPISSTQKTSLANNIENGNVESTIQSNNNVLVENNIDITATPSVDIASDTSSPTDDLSVEVEPSSTEIPTTSTELVKNLDPQYEADMNAINDNSNLTGEEKADERIMVIEDMQEAVENDLAIIDDQISNSNGVEKNDLEIKKDLLRKEQQIFNDDLARNERMADGNPINATQLTDLDNLYDNIEQDIDSNPKLSDEEKLEQKNALNERKKEALSQEAGFVNELIENGEGDQQQLADISQKIEKDLANTQIEIAQNNQILAGGRTQPINTSSDNNPNATTAPTTTDPTPIGSGEIPQPTTTEKIEADDISTGHDASIADIESNPDMTEADKQEAIKQANEELLNQIDQQIADETDPGRKQSLERIKAQTEGQIEASGEINDALLNSGEREGDFSYGNPINYNTQSANDRLEELEPQISEIRQLTSRVKELEKQKAAETKPGKQNKIQKEIDKVKEELVDKESAIASEITSINMEEQKQLQHDVDVRRDSYEALAGDEEYSSTYQEANILAIEGQNKYNEAQQLRNKATSTTDKTQRNELIKQANAADILGINLTNKANEKYIEAIDELEDIATTFDEEDGIPEASGNRNTAKTMRLIETLNTQAENARNKADELQKVADTQEGKERTNTLVYIDKILVRAGQLEQQSQRLTDELPELQQRENELIAAQANQPQPLSVEDANVINSPEYQEYYESKKEANDLAEEAKKDRVEIADLREKHNNSKAELARMEDQINDIPEEDRPDYTNLMNQLKSMMSDYEQRIADLENRADEKEERARQKNQDAENTLTANPQMAIQIRNINSNPDQALVAPTTGSTAMNVIIDTVGSSPVQPNLTQSTNDPNDVAAVTPIDTPPNDTQPNDTPPNDIESNDTPPIDTQSNDTPPNDVVSNDNSPVTNVTVGDPASPVFTPPTVVASPIFKRTTKAVHSSENPIPIDAKDPSGLIYRVQVGAFRNRIPQDLYDAFAPVTGKKLDNGITRYMVGFFPAFTQANNTKNEVRGIGYRDAFVVAYYNGERISISRAREIERGENIPVADNSPNDETSQDNNDTPPNNNTLSDDVNPSDQTSPTTVSDGNAAPYQPVGSASCLFYTVQVGVYSKPRTTTQLFNISPLNRETTGSGLYRYTTGRFSDLAEANRRRASIIVNNNVEDAFVTAYYQGARIQLSRASQLVLQNGDGIYCENGGATTTPSNSTPVNNTPEINPATTPMIFDVPFFTVHLGQFSGEIPNNIATVLLDNSINGIERRKDENDNVIYTCGNYTNFEQAEKLKSDFIAQGVSDAKVVALLGDKEISIEEAIRLLEEE